MILAAKIVIYGYVFIVGAAIGSFLNVVIYRLPGGISISKGRSFCPKCKNSLKGRDLVPVFSYMFLKGKCRYCGDRISLQYPIIELVCGGLAVICSLVYGLSFQAVVPFILGCVLLAISVIDWRTMEIPDGLTGFLIIPAIMSVFLFPDTSILSRILGAVVLSVPMYVLNMFVKDSFGGGDIKLIFVCGFILGLGQTVLAGFTALITGAVYAVFLIARKKAGKGDHFAFGPFLAFGIITSFFIGRYLVDLYLTLLK